MERTCQRFAHHSNGIYRDGKRSIYEADIAFRCSSDGRRKLLRAVNAISQCAKQIFLRRWQPSPKTSLRPTGEDSFSFASILTDPNARMNRGPMIHHKASGGLQFVMVTEIAMETRIQGVSSTPLPKIHANRMTCCRRPDTVEELHEKIKQIVLEGR